jgi:hypothetical protein
MLAQKAAYEAALAEERRLRQENEQKQAAEMAQMYNYIRSLSVQMGNPIPAMQFPVAPAPTTPPVSILIFVCGNLVDLVLQIKFETEVLFIWSTQYSEGQVKGKIRFMPPQLREIGFHVQNHATQWHGFQHEIQFQEVVVAWIQLTQKDIVLDIDTVFEIQL